jgi:hypothetical protein
MTDMTWTLVEMWMKKHARQLTEALYDDRSKEGHDESGMRT